MAPQPDLVGVLEELALAEGTQILDAHKTQLEQLAARVDPQIVSTIVTAVNSKLTDGGLNGIVEGKLRAALVAAQGTMAQSLDASVDALLDKVDEAAHAALAAKGAS